MKPSALQRVPMLWVAGLVVALRILHVWTQWQFAPEAFYGGLNNDALLRLDMIRDLWHGGGWQNHINSRLNYPYGLESPWTRPVDVAVLLVSAPFLLFQPLETALTYGSLFYSSILALITCGLVYAVVRRTGDIPFSNLLVPLAILLYPAIYIYYQPGDVDHHSLLATLSVATVYSAVRFINEEGKRHAVLLGLWLGMGVWVSVEFQFVAAVMVGWLGLVWVITGEDRWQRAMGFMSLSAIGVLCFALVSEHPVSRFFEIRYDTVSIVHLSIFCGLAIFSGILGAFSYRNRAFLRLFTGILGAVFLFLALLWFFPQFYLGPMANVDISMQKEFLPIVAEMQPLFQQWGIGIGCVFIWCLSIGLIISHRTIISFSPYSLLLFLASSFFLLLSLSALRTAYYFGPFSLLLFIHVLHRLNQAGNYPEFLRREVYIVLIGLAPFYLSTLIPQATVFQTENQKAQEIFNANDDQCYTDLVKSVENENLLIYSGKLKTIALSANWGTYILWRTPFSVFTANYHRDFQGYNDLLSIRHWKNEDKARKILAERQVGMIVLCAAPEAELNDNLLNVLEKEKPVWATPVEGVAPKDSPLRIYKIDYYSIP